MGHDKSEKVEALLGQMGIRPVRVIDDQRMAKEADKPWKDLTNDVQWELTLIQAVLWAVDQLALEHDDLTISPLEGASRVHSLVMVARRMVERLDDVLEEKRELIIGVGDRRQAEEAAKPWMDLTDDVQREFMLIQAALWAADQLSLEHNDLTISPLEGASRVHSLVMVARRMVERLDDVIEKERKAITYPDRAGEQ